MGKETVSSYDLARWMVDDNPKELGFIKGVNLESICSNLDKIIKESGAKSLEVIPASGMLEFVVHCWGITINMALLENK